MVGWLVEVGQRVRHGEALLEVETDKAAMAVESSVTGVLKEVRVQDGGEVSAGEVVAIIEADDDAAGQGDQ